MKAGPISLRSDETSLYFKLTQFILENRLAFSAIEPFIKVLKELITDFRVEVLKKIQLSPTTIQKIATNCIAKELKSNIFAKLRDRPFSISIDASSDIYGTSYLAINAKFLEMEASRFPVNKLISVIPMENSSTGKVIYEKIKNEILFAPAIQQNLMGIATDEGKNMIGTEKGVGSRLAREYPHVVHIKDFSHVYNRVCKNAINGFPKEIVEFVGQISRHLKKSAQRRAEFYLIQEKMGLEPLAVLKYTKTRWLSFRNSLTRLLDLWEPLKVYFENQKKKEFEAFTLKNELFLKVLLALTENINHYNEVFQKDNIFYNQIWNKIKEGYVLFAEMVINLEKQAPKFEDYYDMNVELDSQEVLEISDFQEHYFANYYKMEPKFKEIKPKDLEELSISAKKFILLSLQTMKKKLPFKEEIFSDMSVIFLREFNKEKWEKLGEKFKNIISEAEQQNFKYEVRRLGYNFNDVGDPFIISKGNPIEIWTVRAEEYPLCSRLAKALLILPHSTCSVERIFSTMRDFRTPKRSRLTTENLEACLLSYQESQSEDVKISQGMLKRYLEVWKESKPNKESKTGQVGNPAQPKSSNESKNMPIEEIGENKKEEFKEKELKQLLNDLSLDEIPKAEEKLWEESREESSGEVESSEEKDSSEMEEEIQITKSKKAGLKGVAKGKLVGVLKKTKKNSKL